MAGGQPLCADLARHAQQRLELHIRVAVGARDGRAPGEILIDEGAHHARFKLLLEVHHVVRKIQVLRHALSIVDVVERAAAMLRRPVALQLGQTPLVPELHGQPDDGMPLLLQQGRDGRGVDTAAHGHGNQAALNRVARGQSVELGCAAHALFILRENQCLSRSNYLAGSSIGLRARPRRQPPAYDRVAASFR